MHPRDRALERIATARRDGATRLSLEGLGLAELPEELWRLDGLEALDLSSNWLTALPAEIGLLQRLRVLRLSMNRLERLPKEIGLLANIETLDIDQNRLVEIPAEIGGLTRLTRLWLQHNRLTKLPMEMASLAALAAAEDPLEMARGTAPPALRLEGNPFPDPSTGTLSARQLVAMFRSGMQWRVANPGRLRRSRAFDFRSDLSFQDVARKLDAVEDWVGKPGLSGRWLYRDNDRHGDYLSLSAMVGPEESFPVNLALFLETHPKHVTVNLDSTDAEPDPTWETVLSRVLDELLPSIGARDIRPSEFER